LGLYTKPQRLAFARLKTAQLFSALLAASRPALVSGSMQMRYIETAAKCSATHENTMNLEQLLRSRGARRELRTMSALGQKQTLRHVRVMSVIPLKADIH